ncbi:hypothetical protein GS399_15740 [Pedobacter sp. HMF7647]|uniref:Uncharacterized protein n=1 Tax=Hufsiella arboris TaxID=2695275 RepID=A0A7K1YCW8_9SPHI|nr:DUF2683 family protein [Hufsiella arboris]MXV52427.1 hypothetical protein [Hufsiella arboris]
MDAIIVYPENKEQLEAVKAVMNAMKISFEQKRQAYPSVVIEGVNFSLKEAEKGYLTSYKGIDDMLNSK